MPETIPDDSVGIIKPQTVQINTPLKLECGQTFNQHQLTYETYGTLNKSKSNAILICHALSGNHHAAGYHSMDDRKAGWWDSCIGSEKPFDTNKFYIVAVNNLGGCHGSTGPKTTNPATGEPYGPDFPIVTVKDWVISQNELRKALKIEQWVAIIGGSLGGMQVLQWSIDFPDKLKHALVIAAAPRLSAQNIAFNEVARQTIMTDPEFYEGHYYKHQTTPSRGLMLARMLGHLTYLSDDAMRTKFGRELREKKFKYGFDVEFQVESYLRHQGRSFAENSGFDANTYLLMTKALDYFDPAKDYNDNIYDALANATAKFLVVSFTTDWRFAPQRSREIVKALMANNITNSYVEVEASHGHDAFLIPIPHYMEVLTLYMDRVYQELGQ
jgi:homoserine O-acetyltransferase/O-succinyltransferase